MRTLPLVIALALTACSGPSTPATTTSTTDPVDNSGGGASAGGECASSEDCVISCAAPDQCCDAQLCEPCQQVYTRAELAALDAWKAASCADASCPMAKCMAPTEQAVAACNAGQCEVQMAPLPRD